MKQYETLVKDLIEYLSTLDPEMEVRALEAAFVDYEIVEDEYIPIEFDRNDGNIRLRMEDKKQVLLLGVFRY